MDGWMRMGRDSRAVSRVLIHSYARGGMWARCREVARAARPTVRERRRRPLQRRPANARGCGAVCAVTRDTYSILDIFIYHKALSQVNNSYLYNCNQQDHAAQPPLAPLIFLRVPNDAKSHERRTNTGRNPAPRTSWRPRRRDRPRRPARACARAAPPARAHPGTRRPPSTPPPPPSHASSAAAPPSGPPRAGAPRTRPLRAPVDPSAPSPRRAHATPSGRTAPTAVARHSRSHSQTAVGGHAPP